ncbi:MAG: hypothetical protein CSB21_01750 [Deltaproteobacteria bacterium]|nr:MAG: hypothetical protein CSB21_01750 [Deltaproteobacteria bacterium]
MKTLPAKRLTISFLLPLILYFLTTYFIDTYIQKIYKAKTEAIAVPDIEIIFRGEKNIEEAINSNIKNFIATDFFLKHKFLFIDILIINNGTIIYPSSYTVNDNFSKNFSQDNYEYETARKNFSRFQNGLKTRVTTTLTFKSKIIIILLNIFLGLILFLTVYKETEEKNEKIIEKEKNKILQDLAKYQKETDELKSKEIKLSKKIENLNKNYHDSKINEEELLEEIISLEEKINSYALLEKDKEEEINDLKENLDKLSQKNNPFGRKKAYDLLIKRFEILYKNININKKAIDGFKELDDELQLKAEELIKLLDESPDKVIIKRKVFSGKKNKNTSFEVIFAYSGRLYFKRNKENTIEILTIGTKNSQKKDMEYLHNI